MVHPTHLSLQLLAVAAAVAISGSSAFAPTWVVSNTGTSAQQQQRQQSSTLMAKRDHDDDENGPRNFQQFATAALLAATFTTSTLFGGMAFADDAKNYDGFAEYAKENQMEQSDVKCFVEKCGDQTKALFSNPRGIKGVSCLGRCKGEQACAVRCFADYGSDDLNNWLSCTLEDYECVKVPKNIDNSAEDIGYSTAIRNFDAATLVGKWYKTNGLNPNYDLFDCQTNVFRQTPSGADGSKELDMDIFLRISRPEESGGGFWDSALQEHMVVDPQKAERTMHTQGKMNGLTFDENWFILGESDGKGEIPEFKLIAYKGHTLQGNYEGSFVYARTPVLPEACIPAVKAAAAKAGLNWDEYTQIDNSWYVKMVMGMVVSIPSYEEESCAFSVSLFLILLFRLLFTVCALQSCWRAFE